MEAVYGVATSPARALSASRAALPASACPWQRLVKVDVRSGPEAGRGLICETPTPGRPTTVHNTGVVVPEGTNQRGFRYDQNIGTNYFSSKLNLPY